MSGRGEKGRNRVEASSEARTAASSILRAKDGSAFARCEACNKNVPVALISMHSCSLDTKIKLNLEAQVMEMSTEPKKKSAQRKKSSTAEPKAKKSKTEKKVKKSKDSNMPKRPPTAFFLFMDDFRKAYKEAHPGSKDVKAVAKEGGEKWKSLTEEEKKVYLDKASELKVEYDKALESYNVEDEDGDGGSEKEVEGASDGEFFGMNAHAVTGIALEVFSFFFGLAEHEAMCSCGMLHCTITTEVGALGAG